MEVVRYRILKKGRKWFEGEVPEKGWKAKILINPASENFEVGEVVSFPAEVKIEKNRFGTKVEVYPKTWEEYKEEVKKQIEKHVAEGFTKRARRLLDELPENIKKDLEDIVKKAEEKKEVEQTLRRINTLLQYEEANAKRGQLNFGKYKEELENLAKKVGKEEEVSKKYEEFTKVWEESLLQKLEARLKETPSFGKLLSITEYHLPLLERGSEASEKGKEMVRKKGEELVKNLTSLSPKAFYQELNSAERLVELGILDKNLVVGVREKVEEAWDSQNYELMNEISEKLFGKPYEKLGEDRFFVKGIMSHLRRLGKLQPGEDLKVLIGEETRKLKHFKDSIKAKVIPLDIYKVAKCSEVRRRGTLYSEVGLTDRGTVLARRKLASVVGEGTFVWLVPKHINLLPLMKEGENWKKEVYEYLKKMKPEEEVENPFPGSWNHLKREYVAVLNENLERTYVSELTDFSSSGRNAKLTVDESLIKEGDVVVVRKGSHKHLHHSFYRKLPNGRYGHLLTVKSRLWEVVEKELFKLYSKVKEEKERENPSPSNSFSLSSLML